MAPVLDVYNFNRLPASERSRYMFRPEVTYSPDEGFTSTRVRNIGNTVPQPDGTVVPEGYFSKLSDPDPFMGMQVLQQHAGVDWVKEVWENPELTGQAFGTGALMRVAPQAVPLALSISEIRKKMPVPETFDGPLVAAGSLSDLPPFAAKNQRLVDDFMHDVKNWDWAKLREAWHFFD